MALIPSTQWPGKSTAPDANYPYGSARDITIPGDGTGTPFVKVLLDDVFGFQQALLTEAAIVPSGAPDTVVASQYLDALKAIVFLSEYTPLSGPAISLQGYLDRQGIWAEDETGIQQANDYLVAQVKRDVIKLPPGPPIVVNTGLSINGSFVGIQGNGVIIDAAGMASGEVFHIGGTDASPDQQNGVEYTNVIVQGPGLGSSVIGWLFHNGGGGLAGPSRIKLRNIMTTNCGTGEKYGENSFLIEATGCDIRTCGLALHALSTVKGGEDLIRFGGSIRDSSLGMLISNIDGVLRMFGTSIIDNDIIMTNTGGVLDLHGCIIRSNAYSATPITLAGDGAAVHMRGGELGMTAAATFTTWVNAGAATFFRADGVKMVDTETTTKEFGEGVGVIKLDNAIYPSTHGNNDVLHGDRSMVADGGFEEATIVDDIFITASTGTPPIADRHSHGSTILSLDAIVFRSGAQSFEYSKNSGVSSDSSFALASVPVSAFDRMGGRFWWTNPGTNTGSVDFNYTFAKLRVNEEGVPIILHSEVAGTSNIVFSGSPIPWTEETFESASLQAPEWATHFLIVVDGYAWNALAEQLFFDDLNVNKLG